MTSLCRRCLHSMCFMVWILQGILINGQFPGPQIDAVTNDNLIISVYNYLREPFLISWYILVSYSLSHCCVFVYLILVLEVFFFFLGCRGMYASLLLKIIKKFLPFCPDTPCFSLLTLLVDHVNLLFSCKALFYFDIEI